MGEAQYNFDRAMGFFGTKMKLLFNKINMLNENKDLLMKERTINIENIKDLNYENQMLIKKIEMVDEKERSMLH
jgi:hypothetical protein